MELRERNVRPHVAQNSHGRRSAIDRRTTRHPGYAMSQRTRKRIEEAFGWNNTVAGLRKTRFCGLARVDLDLIEPATMTIGADGHGEIAYGALPASLEPEAGLFVRRTKGAFTVDLAIAGSLSGN
jgi:hypothetical protein